MTTDYGVTITSSAVAGMTAGLNLLIYGLAGAGKTYLAKTTGDLEHTLVVAAEPGLLTLRDVEIPVVRVDALDTMQRIYRMLRDSEHGFRWVIIDSISEVAEAVLNEEKARQKDGRKAYGELADRLTSLIKAFRDLPIHVVMIAKQERVQDDDGRLLYGASFPGRKLTQDVPYYFDEVLALRAEEDTDAAGAIVVRRFLQAQPDGRYLAKDRSGALEMFEAPSLSHIAEMILGEGVDSDE